MLCVFVAAFILSNIVVILFNITAFRAGSFSQSCYRFNTYIGLAIVINVLGEEAIRFYGILIGIAIPLVNIFAISTLIWYSENRYKLKDRLRLTLLSLITNPLIISCVAGIVYSSFLSGFPVFIENTFKLAAAVALPLALLSIGASLNSDTIKEYIRVAIGTSMMKLIVLPVLGHFFLKLFGINGLPYVVGMIFFCASHVDGNIPAFISAQQRYETGVGIDSIFDDSFIFYLISPSSYFGVITLKEMNVTTFKNFKLTIEYDGGNFCGWQVQKNARTIQGEIEKAILKMTNEACRLFGSGRTDAGVHALGQVAHFHSKTHLDANIILRGLNGILTDDIVIKECVAVNADFHSRYDVISKVYHYRIYNNPFPSPVHRRYSWHIRKKLDLEAMKASLAYIIGTHDFKSFEGAGSPRSNSIRTVYKAAFDTIKIFNAVFIIFEVEADGFLRYMVRNLLGTLIDVGLNKITSEDFKSILLSKERKAAGATAPPQGLFLVKVNY